LGGLFLKILLIEDDDTVITVLKRSLATHRYIVDVVKDGETGWTYGSTFEYDLIVLDIMLPKLDGITLCQRFRAEGYTTPILLLTAQDSSTAKVQGLNAGADDYVLKPFDQAELIARIRALLRRSSTQSLPLLTWGALLLNPMTCDVTYDGQPLILTTKEYDLLELLLQDSHHVLSSDEILDRLWSSEEFPAEATVRSHIRRLRHKLQAAGAPPDFIGTLHGRGYYLKPFAQNDSRLNSLSIPQSESGLTVTASPNQQDYLAFLNETWRTAQPNCLEQLAAFDEVVKALQTDKLTNALQQNTRRVAHKLVGTLGVFGLTQGEQIARRLDQMLSSNEILNSVYTLELKHLVQELESEIKTASAIQPYQTQFEPVPFVLVIASDRLFTEPLEAIALQKGIRIVTLTALETVSGYLDQNSPNVILLRATHPTLLKTISEDYPHLPVLVVGDQDLLSDRLNVVRRGGKFLLEQSVTPTQIIACALDLAKHPTPEAKVMIVDDDADWLRTLPRLLEPWHFKVTTLADPQQFWTVLQSVNPDALVLDIKMPEVNGLELCQVLRSDPHWQRLPILFVSVLEDSRTQNQAFTVGADDYLCKPVAGADLASRILNRLARIRSWEI
jgi:DNA-binding response OmpR family regulator/HPt (histidine-containing phosphotransfer) domain-containing protein